ncbi:transcription antitermination protein NusB [Spiroplasma chinense]|uniref:Transcription antitermination protein NusB n=1 Tax=Spiroplasma chinense TaxID=216932 RepID=A0A5B9Y4Y3_9MOLU|nr:transcription antitermination factor NusB [Spiroplasma chinense]QEH61875.1 transcription antitermination protein NusB [Spiroplasma chinense]
MENKSISFLKKQRRYTVQIIYKLIILQDDTARMKQEILDGLQLSTKNEEIIQYIENVIDKYFELRDELEPLLEESWWWERLPMMVRAILISSLYEIKYYNTPKAIVIDEAIEMVREFIPSWETNFINAVLDKAQY